MGSHWQRLRPALGAWRRIRYASSATAAGIALSLATVVVSALNIISSQQAIALAVPAVLITVGGLVGQIVPEAWIAWRRGFRHGCEAALTSQACLASADDAGSKSDEIRRAETTSYPARGYCAVCGRRVYSR